MFILLTWKIFLIVAVIAGTSGFVLASNATLTEVNQEQQNNEIILPYIPLSCNCVAFRLDDIKDASYDEVQFQTLSFFTEREIPITIGIIGNKFGNDTLSVNIIKEFLQKNGDKLEIANHGWNHEPFTKFNKKQQSDIIKKTNDKLLEKLGITPKVFIPPFNRFNEDTIRALEENGITHMSAAENPTNLLQKSTFSRYPATSTTGEFSKIQDELVWLPWSGKRTFNAVANSVIDYGFAVVMMHPKDFGQFAARGNALNLEQIHELEYVIEKIHEAGWDIVPIGKIS